MTVAHPVALDAAVERASAILGADPSRALREAEAILKLAPGDPRARLIAGSARRRLGDTARAKAILGPLAAAYPRAAHTQYELGLVFEALGERKKAIAALRNAVVLRRELPEAWRALGDLLFLDGDATGAEAAFAEHGLASIGDPALRPAAAALFAGRLAEAETLLRARLLRRTAGDAVALRLLGEALLRQERHGEAEAALAEALRRDADDHGGSLQATRPRSSVSKGAAALAQVETLLALEPREAAYLNLLAGCLALLGDFDRAIETYEDLLATYARQPRIWLNHGHVLRTVGRRGDAVNAYRHAVSLAPGLGDAYWSLANLKVAALSDVDEAAIEAQLSRSELDPEDRLHLCYALGKALEDRGAYAEAFQRYVAGAALRRRTLAYDADEQTAFARGSMALFTPAFFATRAGAGSLAADPIFIVGLPRSGSTLIEQILASHSAVEGTMELPEIGLFANSLAEAGAASYPDCVARLSGADLRSLGELFLDAHADSAQARPAVLHRARCPTISATSAHSRGGGGGGARARARARARVLDPRPTRRSSTPASSLGGGGGAATHTLLFSLFFFFFFLEEEESLAACRARARSSTSPRVRVSPMTSPTSAATTATTWR